MSYTLSRTGKLNYVHAYKPSIGTVRQQPQQQLIADSVRPVQLYLNAEESIEPGHLVQWTGTPDMFLESGERVDSFDENRGHEHALTSVQTLVDRDKMAGVVLEVAATEDKKSYIHRGVHTMHSISNHSNILRVATNGCALAWVLDTHENVLDGLYTLYKNGTAVGQSIVRTLNNDYFTIDHLDNVDSDRLDALEAKFAELTG